MGGPGEDCAEAGGVGRVPRGLAILSAVRRRPLEEPLGQSLQVRPPAVRTLSRTNESCVSLSLSFFVFHRFPVMLCVPSVIQIRVVCLFLSFFVFHRFPVTLYVRSVARTRAVCLFLSRFLYFIDSPLRYVYPY